MQIKFRNDFRRIVESEEYQRLFPQVKLSKNTETEVHTSWGGYRYARSAEGSLTGIGGGILILDDFQRPLDMLSDARRISTNASYYNTVASRVDNQNTGAIVVVGQRLHPEDHIGTLLRSPEGWPPSLFPRLRKGKKTFQSGRAGGISAASAISCIRNNRTESILRRYVLRIPKSLRLNINKVRYRRAAF